MVSEEQNALFTSGTIILDFGSKSCGPCKLMSPFLESVLNAYPGIQLVNIDVEEECDLASKFKVKGVPQLVFLKNGREIDRLSGGHTPRKLKKFIDECIAKS